MGRRGPKPKQQLPIRWTAELAYIVGLIATDGCLYNDGRHINFTSNDLELVHTFMRCLGLKNKVSRKRSGFANTWAYNLQFGNVVLYNWLCHIGLMTAKSKTLGGVLVPKRYFPDFLRGLFDGDGSFYSYFDPRWPSSHMFYLIFGSASQKHILWLRKILNQYYEVSGHGAKNSYSRIYQLKYAKREAQKLFRIMYHSASVPCLERKRNKVYNAIAIEQRQ